MKENEGKHMLQFAPQILLYLSPSSIFKSFCQFQVYEERTFTKTVSTEWTDKKLMQEKV